MSKDVLKSHEKNKKVGTNCIGIMLVRSFEGESYFAQSLITEQLFDKIGSKNPFPYGV